MEPQLAKRWKMIEVVLERACAALPAPAVDARTDFDSAIAEFREFLARNELELALDALAAAADIVSARGGVWRDLERAAEFMNLAERASELHRRYVLAIAEP